jgi:hypothetical protein
MARILKHEFHSDNTSIQFVHTNKVSGCYVVSTRSYWRFERIVLHSSSGPSSQRCLAALRDEHGKQVITPPVFTYLYADVDKAPADPAGRVGGSVGQWGPQTYKKLKFVVGSFGLDFVLLTKRKHSGFLLWDLGVMSLIFIRAGWDYQVVGPPTGYLHPCMYNVLTVFACAATLLGLSPWR